MLLPDGHGLVTVAVGTPGVHIDPLTLARTPDSSGVRGLADRAFVREQHGPAVRLGAQLDPVALARMGVRAAGPRSRLGVRRCSARTCRTSASPRWSQGRDADAAALLGAALAAHAVPPPRRLAARGARAGAAQRDRAARPGPGVGPGAGRPTSRSGSCYREVVQTLGITPEAFLAAVRFSAFVRDAVGPGPVRPEDALAVLRWYLRAGYPPREVERFTGLSHVELRRLEEGIAAALGVAA